MKKSKKIIICILAVLALYTTIGQCIKYVSFKLNSSSSVEGKGAEYIIGYKDKTSKFDSDYNQRKIEEAMRKLDDTDDTNDTDEPQDVITEPTLENVVHEAGEFSGEPSVIINNNTPYFNSEEIEQGKTSFENYSELDSLGRTGVAFASISKETMPKEGEERGSIGMIKPAGWHTVKYAGIDGHFLYNRCHEIAWCLGSENNNALNLTTGTRYMNVEGMLPYETKVAQYCEDTGNHVLYRVTPVFEGNNLIASGILMEAYSVEDAGEGIKFCVYCYNTQPGITIDYATGESSGPEYE